MCWGPLSSHRGPGGPRGAMMVLLQLPRRNCNDTRTYRCHYIINDLISTFGCRLLVAGQLFELCCSHTRWKLVSAAFTLLPVKVLRYRQIPQRVSCHTLHSKSSEVAALGVSSRVNCIINPQAVKREAWLEFTLEPSLSRRHNLALCIRVSDMSLLINP